MPVLRAGASAAAIFDLCRARQWRPQRDWAIVPLRHVPNARFVWQKLNRVLERFFDLLGHGLRQEGFLQKPDVGAARLIRISAGDYGGKPRPPLAQLPDEILSVHSRKREVGDGHRESCRLRFKASQRILCRSECLDVVP